MLAREGAFSLVDLDELPSTPRMVFGAARLIERRDRRGRAAPERLTVALNRLGPSYVKLGQFLATRPDIVGEEAADALGRLRDEIAPFPEAEARAVVEKALGKPVDALFASFSPPVAAASIAQVHKAEIAGGERRHAAGRGQGAAARRPRPLPPRPRDLLRRRPPRRASRPGVAAPEADRGGRHAGAVGRRSRWTSASRRRRSRRWRSTTAGDRGFRVPQVEWELTARDVLTLEWIDGIKLSDLAALRAAGHDLPALAQTLIQAFLRHALRDGFFHADMHQGNLFVDAAGDIVAVDFGIMGRLGLEERRFLAEILFGFIRRDYRRVAEVHFEAGYVPGDRHSIDDFAQALRAIGEPIHGQKASDISMARLLTLLFEVTEIFDMQTRPELLLVQKTMVVVEGVARSLDPDFDMWSASEPVVGEWIERYLGPAGQIERVAAEGVGALGRLVGELPRLAERAERLSVELDRMGERGMRLDPDTIADIGRSEAHAARYGRVALWIIAAAAVILALKLLF